MLHMYAERRYSLATRIQIVMDEVEREAFRQAAAREGLTLSDWLRCAARDRLKAGQAGGFCSVDDLRQFFAACRQRETGHEPDWQEHHPVIETSRASGRPAT